VGTHQLMTSMSQSSVDMCWRSHGSCTHYSRHTTVSNATGRHFDLGLLLTSTTVASGFYTGSQAHHNDYIHITMITYTSQ